MHTPRLSILTALAALAAACAPGEPALYLTSNVSTFDGRTQHAVLRVQAFQADGQPGQGVVSLVTPAGHFADGAQVSLVDGIGSASFLCDPAEDTACNGPVRVSATWAALTAGVSVRVTPVTTVTQVHWKAVSTGTLEALNALAVADARTLWAVGTGGAVRRLVDATWGPVLSGTQETLLAVSMADGGVPVAVGERGTFLRWQGSAFELLGGDPKEDYTAVAARTGDDVIIGTASGALLHWDGAQLVAEADLGSPVRSLTVRGDEVWAGGVGAMAVRSQGAWQVQTSPVLASLQVALPSPEGLYLGGSRMDVGGGVLLLGPAEWRTQTLSQPLTALAVVPQSMERFAVTSSQVLRAEGTGTAWVSTSAPMGGSAAGSRGLGDLVVVGPAGLSIMRVP